LSNKTEELNTSTKIIVYNANGSNSSTVCDRLIKNGSERVYNLLSGLNAWSESGYPVVSTSTPEEPGFEAALALAALLVIACWVRQKKVSHK
jgi:3-mercaptopyruvate sulfurtransferase SseA